MLQPRGAMRRRPLSARVRQRRSISEKRLDAWTRAASSRGSCRLRSKGPPTTRAWSRSTTAEARSSARRAYARSRRGPILTSTATSLEIGRPRRENKMTYQEGSAASPVTRNLRAPARRWSGFVHGGGMSGFAQRGQSAPRCSGRQTARRSAGDGGGRVPPPAAPRAHRCRLGRCLQLVPQETKRRKAEATLPHMPYEPAKTGRSPEGPPAGRPCRSATHRASPNRSAASSTACLARGPVRKDGK